LIIGSTLVSTHGCPAASGGGRQPVHTPKRVELRQGIGDELLDRDPFPPTAVAQLDLLRRINAVVTSAMKTHSPTRSRPHSWSVPLACDQMPYLDKPRLRRALGGATVAGGLLLGAADTKAQEPPVTFALRSMDGLQRISLWNLAVDYEGHPDRSSLMSTAMGIWTGTVSPT
jgi:hypothetical protein